MCAVRNAGLNCPAADMGARFTGGSARQQRRKRECCGLYHGCHASARGSGTLLRLTQTDSLTGVLNKRTTEQRCRTLLENTPGEKPFALLLLDVDNFKQTNDRYGHPKGDAVLRCLGENLSGLFRRMDVVGRVGGENFLMMMPGAGGEQAVGRAQKIAQEMCRSVSVQCGVDVSGSIGVVLSKPGACAYEELLRRADSALYAAKAAGKGCYRVYGGA